MRFAILLEIILLCKMNNVNQDPASVLTFANFRNKNTQNEQKQIKKAHQTSNIAHNNTSSKHVIITDVRKDDDFAGITFSMYKRSQVKKSLIEAMNRCAIEEANYWAAELICCGCYIELWEVIMEFMGRNINTSNPKFAGYSFKVFSGF